MPAERKASRGRQGAQGATAKRATALLVLATGAGALAACVGSLAELDEGGRNVTVIASPMPGCTYLSTSYGRGYFREYALNNLRNQVASNGATHVVITDETQLMQGFIPVGGNSLTVQGMGYKCASPGAPPKR